MPNITAPGHLLAPGDTQIITKTVTNVVVSPDPGGGGGRTTTVTFDDGTVLLLQAGDSLDIVTSSARIQVIQAIVNAGG